MRGDCLYFTRFTVDADGSYYPASPELMQRVVDDAFKVPAIRTVVDLCRSRLGIDVLAEIRRGPRYDNPLFSKTIQGILYTSLGYYCNEFYHRPIRSIGFYSGGVVPAYLFSRVIRFEQYIDEVSSFVNEYYAARDQKGQEHELSQVLLRGDAGDDVLMVASQCIEDARLENEAFIKDRRQRHTVLIAGLTPAVVRVRDAVACHLPTAASRGGGIRRVNAAHLPLVDREAMLPLLDGVRFRPPAFTIVGTRGQVVPAGCVDEDLVKSVFVEAFLGLMNTGESIERIAGLADRMIAIGSDHSLGVFDGIAAQALPPMAIASAEVLDGSFGRSSRHEIGSLHAERHG